MKLFNTIGIVVSCSALFACASPIQQMSGAEAMKFGSDQFYQMPSYRFDVSTKVVEMGYIKAGVSTNQTEKADSISKHLNFFGKKFIFNGTGVIDTVNDQYQVIPEYGYQSKNVNANIRFPIVLDRKAKLLYADLSAMDGLLTDIDNEGKYSRFDLKQLPIPEDTDKKLVDIMRKYSSQVFDHVPKESITDLPLTSEDRKFRAVRKIQLTMNPRNQLAMYPNVMKDVFSVLTSKNSQADAEITEEQQHGMEQDGEKFKSELEKMIGPDSRDIYTVAFNRAGQIVSMNVDSQYTFGPNAGQAKSSENPEVQAEIAAEPVESFKMHLKSDMTVTDIGSAKLIDPPTAENSVDGMENIKNSLIGKSFFSKNDVSDDEALSATDAAVWDEPVQKPVKKKKRRSRR